MNPNKESNIEKELPEDSPLKRLIKIFRTNTVVKHHFQGNGSTRPIGVAKSFFKNSYQNFSNNIAGFVQYERMSRYSDYCEMVSYPIIGKALQIYADECTQKDEDGKIVKVVSESKETEEIIQDLFDNVLQLNGKKINKIVRDMCKYGDTYYLIDITTDNGVVNLIQMPANEVEREEGYDKDEPTAVKFKWNARNTNQEIPNAFVAHFRYDGDDMFYPYGMSILEAARRPWRQLCLSSNTLIWTNKGQKRISEIVPGDMIYSYDHVSDKVKLVKVKNCLKTGTKETFSLKTAHRQIELTPEHKVLVKTKDDSFEYKCAKDIVLSNGEGGQSYRNADRLVLPRLSGETVPSFEIDADLYFVEMKNPVDFEKSGIIQTLRRVLGKENVKNEHSFLRGKKRISYVTFSLLKSVFGICDDDVVFYLRNSKKRSFLDKFKFIPNLDFVRFLGFMHGDGWTKKNGIGFALGEYPEQNDYYINLCKSLFSVDNVHVHTREGTKSSQALVDSKELRLLFDKIGFITGFSKKRIPEWVFSLPMEYKFEFIKGVVDADGENDIGRLGLSNEGLIQDVLVLAQQVGLDCSRRVYVDRHASKKFDKYFDKIVDRKTSYRIWLNFNNFDDSSSKLTTFETANHLIQNKVEDVYDIEVDDDLHNFIANGVVVHNCLLEDAMMVYRITRSAERRAFYLDVMGIPPDNVPQMIEEFNQELKKKKVVNDQGKIDLRYGGTLDMVEDYIVPVRGSDSATRIESLPGGQNIGDIEDIEFIKKNLFAAIGIPKAFLTFDEGIGSKQTLTVEDIRFARTVSKIQECIINELIKIALIHLYIKGKRGRDLINFKIKMTNPSTVAEMQKNELWRARMDLVQAAGQGVFDTTFIYKNFLKLSDEAIDMIKKGQIQDKIFQAKLLALENSGGAIGAGGMGGMGGGMDMMGGMGSMGGGMGGGMMGGAPPLDMGGGMGASAGGAEPNVMGMPESINIAANVFDNNADGRRKDLSRTGKNRRLKNIRGLMDDELVSFEDVADQGLDSFDHDGIRRAISSPMGQNESRKIDVDMSGYVTMAATALDRKTMSYLEECFDLPTSTGMIFETKLILEKAFGSQVEVRKESDKDLLEEQFEKVNKMIEDFE